MSNSQLLTAAISVVYLAVAYSHFTDGRLGLAVAFFGYAFANIGLVLAETP